MAAAGFFSATGVRLGGSAQLSVPFDLTTAGAARYIASVDGRLRVGECSSDDGGVEANAVSATVHALITKQGV